MKKLIRLMTLSAFAATLVSPALGNTARFATAEVNAVAAAAAVQGGEDEAKAALYKTFTDNRTTNQKLAYDTAKEYLAKYPAEDQYTAYLKKWIAAYEKASRKADLAKMINDQKFAEAFALGKQILADEPNDLLTLSNVSWAGLNLASTGKDATNVEASNYARKTLQLIEAGKGYEEGKPLDAKAKSESINWLNYALAVFALKNNPNQSIDYLLKVAQTEGRFQKDPATFALLAVAYQAGPYNTLSKDYQTRFPQGSVETPESKAALENLNQVIDRIIDAYARAVASATDPKYATKKAEWTTQLTNFYKFRHNDSDAGLQEMIAGILSKPIPPQPTLNATPAPSTSATPSTTTGGATSATGTTAGTTTPAATAPASTSSPSTNQPAATPSPTPANTNGSKPQGTPRD